MKTKDLTEWQQNRERKPDTNPRGVRHAAPSALAGPGSHANNTAALDPARFATSEFSFRAEPDNPDLSPCAASKVARERFLARHGPGADVPRRPSSPREIRKALIAAEIARWECF